MVCDGAHTSQHIPSMYVRRNLRSLVFRVEKKVFQALMQLKCRLGTRNRPCVRVAGNE